LLTHSIEARRTKNGQIRRRHLKKGKSKKGKEDDGCLKVSCEVEFNYNFDGQLAIFLI
jgi:hypothetical protein